ncbi:hypothetical protein Tco_0792383 [Tanacetum coccineum]
MEQMLLAKKDEARVILYDEHNDFFLGDAAQMEELKELSANIWMMARIQKADSDSEDRPSYDYAFISENDNLNDEIEKLKRESIDVQENLLKRIKILEYDFQRCQAQSIDFELQLQHQKEKIVNIL